MDSPLPRLLFCALLVTFLAGPSHARSFKRGLAYGYNAPADLAAISPGVHWWYNWAVTPETAVADVYRTYGMEFVPMAWGAGFNTTRLRTFLQSNPDVKYILGFNEPNFRSQANLTPSAAAAAWPALEAIADEFNLEIVGPAVNYCGDCVSENGTSYTDPVVYLDDFFAVCPGCRVDYIAVHNYMCYRSALQSYINRFYKYGKKIWLTEFACWDQPASVVTSQFQIDYMRAALSALESDTMVFRYAWFIGRTDDIGAYPYQSIFAAAPGVLTDLGRHYVDFPASVDAGPIPRGAVKHKLRTFRGPHRHSFSFETGALHAGAMPVITIVDCLGRTISNTVSLYNGSATVHLGTGMDVSPKTCAVFIQLPGQSFALTMVLP
ncbi:MAG: glycoside hydrolase family protein [Chitinispirillaceae bacterium]|nr:glycoside hydrolase family protein [Chitinispirillaceae bacterium]